MRYLLRFLLGCCLLACQLPAGAQAPVAGDAPAARPRIGLVLSGGGARGAAHVGVLKVLDDLHVPVDAIAGTSMGAVVGGLYASGRSGREIEQILSSVDWQDAFRDRSQRSDLNFRRKREDQEFLVQLPLGFREGRFFLPRGLIQGQKLSKACMAIQALHEGTSAATIGSLNTPLHALLEALESSGRLLEREEEAEAAGRAGTGLSAAEERGVRFQLCGDLEIQRAVEAIDMVHYEGASPPLVRIAEKSTPS